MILAVTAKTDVAQVSSQIIYIGVDILQRDQENVVNAYQETVSNTDSEIENLAINSSPHLDLDESLCGLRLPDFTGIADFCDFLNY